MAEYDIIGIGSPIPSLMQPKRIVAGSEGQPGWIALDVRQLSQETNVPIFGEMMRMWRTVREMVWRCRDLHDFIYVM